MAEGLHRSIMGSLWISVFAVFLLLSIHNVHSFYLPGVAPEDFEKVLFQSQSQIHFIQLICPLIWHNVSLDAYAYWSAFWAIRSLFAISDLWFSSSNLCQFHINIGIWQIWFSFELLLYYLGIRIFRRKFKRLLHWFVNVLMKWNVGKLMQSYGQMSLIVICLFCLCNYAIWNLGCTANYIPC